MQHRWERMLNRAETETTLAAEKVRANRAARAAAANDANAPTGFEQPAYGGAGATTDVKTPETAPTTRSSQPSRRRPPIEADHLAPIMSGTP